MTPPPYACIRLKMKVQVPFNLDFIWHMIHNSQQQQQQQQQQHTNCKKKKKKRLMLCCLNPQKSVDDVNEHAQPVQICFLRSSRIRVDLLSYESKPTDKREQYDWRAEKNFDGKQETAGKN